MAKVMRLSGPKMCSLSARMPSYLVMASVRVRLPVARRRGLFAGVQSIGVVSPRTCSRSVSVSSYKAMASVRRPADI